MEVTIALDIGGTQIKGGVLMPAGALLQDRILTFDAMSKAPADTILDGLLHCIAALGRTLAPPVPQEVSLGFAFPGPFDYTRGVSLIRGVDKYEALYGVDIWDALKKRISILQNPDPILGTIRKKPRFINDVAAFALGESHYGVAKGFRRAMYLCIGTGAGSAFTVEGRLQTAPAKGVPENGWIYATPFKGSVIDDYISVRGLAALSLAHLGRVLDGKALFDMAQGGDPGALDVFDTFGKNILEALRPFLLDFMPDVLVLGGQISGAQAYLDHALQGFCLGRGITLVRSRQTSVSTLKGIYAHVHQEE